jgi:multidrug resistance efflux pump
MKNKLFSLSLLVALLLSACGSANTPVPTSQPVIDAVTLSTVTAEGKLLPASAVELAFAQGGVVSEILAQPDDSLATGAPIARLIGLEAAQAQLATAGLELESAKKALNDLQNAGNADLAQAVIDLKDAREEYEDAVDYLDYLHDSKKVPQTETRRILMRTWRGYYYQVKTKHFKGPAPEDWIIEAENDLALDQAKMDELQRKVDRLKGGVDVEQLPILQARLEAAHANVMAASAAIELYELRAPFDGVLLSHDLHVGESVAPTLPIAFLADPSRWTIETKDLAEIDVSQIAVGDPVTIKLDAFPDEEFPGTVTEIDPVGREYLGDMTYKVTIALDQADPRFLWNMTATVTVNTADD